MAKDFFKPGDSSSASSKFGQLIGEAFENTVIRLVKSYIGQKYPDYEILAPTEGRKLITLEMLGGSSRQLDTVITKRDSEAPIALLETKWLKDSRHHNDKGAWILQLREVKKKYATVRGAVAILAGYWNEGVGVMLMSEGGIKMVWVATDDEVYSTFQPHLDQFLGQNSFVLDTKQMRKRYWRPHDLANCAISLKKSGKLDEIAKSWLYFKRKDENEKETTGKELIKQAIDKLLSPLTRNPTVQNIQISLNIDTGNMIYQEFEDFEAAMEFIQRHVQNPDQILARIMPKPKVKVKDDSS